MARSSLRGLRAALAHDPRYGVLDLATGQSLSLHQFIGDGDYGDLVQNKRVALEHDLLEGRIRYVCVKCRKPMVLRSKAVHKLQEDRFFLKHRYRSEECGGMKGMTHEAICALKYANTKEGAEHKRYKDLIVDSLAADPKFSDTRTETRWFDLDGVHWRQPDVQSAQVAGPIALEVQLSTTFVEVVAQRQAFYRRNVGRLLWFFRELDIPSFRQAEDDIFNTNNRNAFHLNAATLEASQRHGRFALECAWLEPVLCGREIVNVYRKALVYFDQLRFDVSAIGVPRAYFFDYDAARVEMEASIPPLPPPPTPEVPVHFDFNSDVILRQVMEEMVRGFPNHLDNGRIWENVRAKFQTRGFDLPKHYYYNDGLFPILQAAYSAKLARPVSCGQPFLIQLANTLFNSHKPALFVFSVMMWHYARGALLRERGDGDGWKAKVKCYQAAWLNGDPVFEPDRRHDNLLVFLFPDAASLLRMTPHDYLAHRRAKTN